MRTLSIAMRTDRLTAGALALGGVLLLGACGQGSGAPVGRAVTPRTATVVKSAKDAYALLLAKNVCTIPVSTETDPRATPTGPDDLWCVDDHQGRVTLSPTPDSGDVLLMAPADGAILTGSGWTLTADRVDAARLADQVLGGTLMSSDGKPLK